MTYSIIGILASVILLIINQDLLRKGRTLTKAQKAYRSFLMGVMAYYVTDLLWGILDENHLTTLLYADTAVHFAAMAMAVMLWTQYVIEYLGGRTRFERMLYLVGRLFMWFELIVVIINFFFPILFSIDENGTYHAHIARYITLGIQIIMFLLTSVYTLQITAKSEGSDDRSVWHRHDRSYSHSGVLSAHAFLCNGLHAWDLCASQLCYGR